MSSSASSREEANRLFNLKKYYEAIGVYSQGLVSNPSDKVLLGNRAQAYIEVNDFFNALRDCTLVLEQDPHYTKVIFRAAKCHTHMGNLDDALALLQSNSSTLHPEIKVLKQLQLQLKHYHLHILNDPESALKALEQAMTTLDPELLGSALPKSISSIATAALNRMPLKWRLWRGEALVAVHDFSEAAQVAVEILRVDPRNSDALLLRARTMYLLDSHPVATVRQFIVQCLTFDPDNQAARLLLKHVKLLEQIKTAGNDAFKSSDYETALAEYESFLETVSPDSIARGKVLSNRATVYGKVCSFTYFSF
jgi:DnaJ family protein C protein 7